MDIIKDTARSIYLWWGLGILLFIIILILINKKKRKNPMFKEVIVLASEVECPYCHTPFKNRDITVLCSSCQTIHHKDCWVDNGGCGVFGCWQRSIKKYEKKQSQ